MDAGAGAAPGGLRFNRQIARELESTRAYAHGDRAGGAVANMAGDEKTVTDEAIELLQLRADRIDELERALRKVLAHERDIVLLFNRLGEGSPANFSRDCEEARRLVFERPRAAA